MSKIFDKKIVVITGAAGGIGKELARHFGRKGAIIYAIDKKDTVNTLAIDLATEGIIVYPLTCDIGDAELLQLELGELIQQHCDVDILINNAGFSEHPTIEKTSPADWAFDINGNLNGAYNCVYTVLPGMRRKGKAAIVTVGSVNGIYALGDPAYSAAKAALISMTKAIALENGRFGIRSNIVLPGTVRTPIWEERAKKDPEVLKTLIRWYPLARIAEPSDIANAVSFLASDAAAAITGAELAVDCGLTAGNIVMSRELTLENF
jgi:NAD(P)-dependent dehydrogenase (short-subunit alcohol dehydrogenase family)